MDKNLIISWEEYIDILEDLHKAECAIKQYSIRSNQDALFWIERVERKLRDMKGEKP